MAAIIATNLANQSITKATVTIGVRVDVRPAIVSLKKETTNNEIVAGSAQQLASARSTHKMATRKQTKTRRHHPKCKKNQHKQTKKQTNKNDAKRSRKTQNRVISFSVFLFSSRVVGRSCRIVASGAILVWGSAVVKWGGVHGRRGARTWGRPWSLLLFIDTAGDLCVFSRVLVFCLVWFVFFVVFGYRVSVSIEADGGAPADDLETPPTTRDARQGQAGSLFSGRLTVGASASPDKSGQVRDSLTQLGPNPGQIRTNLGPSSARIRDKSEPNPSRTRAKSGPI